MRRARVGEVVLFGRDCRGRSRRFTSLVVGCGLVHGRFAAVFRRLRFDFCVRGRGGLDAGRKGLARRAQRLGEPARADQKVFGGFGHLRFLERTDTFGCRVAFGFTDGLEDTAFGDAAEIVVEPSAASRPQPCRGRRLARRDRHGRSPSGGGCRSRTRRSP